MPARRAPKGDAGYLLIFLMMGVAVMMIMLTAAGQSWSFQMRREREVELIFRGEQYMNGLAAFRKANGNAFPVGDLKVLAQKNPTGIRFMRKLYKNPMDPNGKWQYLYLHPGGTGFINPCAVGGGAGFNDPTAGAGFGRGRGGGFGASTDVGLPGSRGIIGSNSDSGDDDSDEPGRGLPTGAARSGLSAMDPKTFKETGIQKMNLPIVGVVNCQMVESIRTYKGQTWLSNWAFTPLAQGEFGANAAAGGSTGSSAGLVGGGIGMDNGIFTTPALRNANQRVNMSDSGNSWRRSQQAPPPPGGRDDSGQDSGPNTRQPDPSQPSHPQQPPNPNAPPDPNKPADPNQIEGDPDDPDGSYDDEDDESDDEDEGDDEEEEDPNAPVDPNAPPPSNAGGASCLS